MNNNAPFYESDVCHTLDGPMVNQYLHKVPRHIFRLHTLLLGEYMCYQSECKDRVQIRNNRRQGVWNHNLNT